MESRREGPNFMTGRLVVGLFILLQGVLIALSYYDITPEISFWQYWPVVLILIGLIKVIQPGASRVGGFILAAVGGVLLGDSLDLIDVDFRDLFPFALILLGIFLVTSAFRRPGRTARGEVDSSSTIDAFAVLGGVRRVSSSQSFRGGSAGAILGGCEIDLRNAAIADGEAVIDVFALWGGVDIAVPEGWSVAVQGFPLLGAFEDNTRQLPGETSQRLVIRGLVIMGGVDVKHKLG